MAHWEGAAGFQAPSYFLAFDPSTKECILAIRGTKSLVDVLTDVVHTPVQMFDNDTFVHSGISNAARFVVKRVLPLLENLFLPLGYSVTLTGHSLGAGTATLVSSILTWEMNIKNKCYAFAPPPTMSKKAAEVSSSFVYSMVHNDDVVPVSPPLPTVRIFSGMHSFSWHTPAVAQRFNIISLATNFKIWSKLNRCVNCMLSPSFHTC